MPLYVVGFKRNTTDVPTVTKTNRAGNSISYDEKRSETSASDHTFRPFTKFSSRFSPFSMFARLVA